MKYIRNKLLSSIYVLLISLLTIQLYTIIHEGAHALTAKFFGATITKFNINLITFNPSISYNGVTDNQIKALISLAGPFLPLIIILPLVYQMSKSRNIIIRIAGLIQTIGLIFSNLINVILPILYLLKFDVHDEDIIKFINYTGYNAVTVSFCFGLIFLVLIYFFNKRYGIRNGLKEFKSIYLTTKEMIFITTIATIIIIFSFLNRASYESYELDQNIDFDLILEESLNNLSLENECFYKFNIKKPVMYSFYSKAEGVIDFKLELNANEGHFYGIRGEKLELLEGSGNLNSQYTNWILEEGEYEIRVYSPTNKGNFKVGIDIADIPEKFKLIRYEDIINKNIPIDTSYELICNEIIKNETNIILYEFTLNHNTEMALSIYNTSETGDLEIKIIGDNTSEVILGNNQIYTDGRGTYLEKGSYQIVYNSKNSNGELYIFMKENL